MKRFSTSRPPTGAVDHRRRGASSRRGKHPARIIVVHLTTVPMSLRFLAGQTRYMKRRGFELVAVSSPGADLKDFSKCEGIQVEPVAMERRITLLRDLAALFRIWRILRRIRPSVVQSHTPKAGFLGTVAAWLARVPARIYHMHGLPFVTRSGFVRHLLRFTEWTACTLANRVFCVSRSTREVAIANGVCHAQKIRVLLNGSSNGVDTARFSPPDATSKQLARAALGLGDQAFVLGFIGRVVRDKGIVELAQAWQLLRAEAPDLRLLLVGPVEVGDPVPWNVLEQLRSDPRVISRGLDWDTPRLYAAMDTLVLPSHREGFGLVALEAAAMGLPVVATRIAGCIDAVVDGVTGTLVPPRDVPALAGAIRRYWTDPELRNLHGRTGRKRAVQDFRQEPLWAAMVDEYRALLEERGAGRFNLSPPERLRDTEEVWRHA